MFDIIVGKQPHPFFGVVCCALKHGSTFPPLPDSHSRSQKKVIQKITLTIPLSSRYYSQANTASQHRLALWRLRATPATSLPPSRTQIYVLEDRKKKNCADQVAVFEYYAFAHSHASQFIGYTYEAIASAGVQECWTHVCL